jgi:hypothetical protein
MDKFILDWGTEVALVIALLGSSFIVWVTTETEVGSYVEGRTV